MLSFCNNLKRYNTMSILHNYTNFHSSGLRSQIIAALHYRVAFISHIIRTYRQNKSGCSNSFSNSLLYTCASVSRTARDFLFNTVCGGGAYNEDFFYGCRIRGYLYCYSVIQFKRLGKLEPTQKITLPANPFVSQMRNWQGGVSKSSGITGVRQCQYLSD